MKRVVWVLLALLAGCASEVVRSPTTLMPVPAAVQPADLLLTVRQPLTLRASSAYDRTVSAGSRFEAVGDIEQGRVYRPVNTVFSVVGKHEHEAYLVIHRRQIVGFFLPVERAFAPAAAPVDLP